MDGWGRRQKEEEERKGFCYAVSAMDLALLYHPLYLSLSLPLCLDLFYLLSFRCLIIIYFYWFTFTDPASANYGSRKKWNEIFNWLVWVYLNSSLMVNSFQKNEINNQLTRMSLSKLIIYGKKNIMKLDFYTKCLWINFSVECTHIFAWAQKLMER